MDLVHALETAEEAGERRRTVEHNVEAVIEHHAAIHCDSKRRAVFPASEPAVSGHEKQADGSDGDQGEADKELLGVFFVLPGESAMLVVDAVMSRSPWAYGVCFPRRISMFHQRWPTLWERDHIAQPHRASENTDS
jgi:hypothetical protein